MPRALPGIGDWAATYFSGFPISLPCLERSGTSVVNPVRAEPQTGAGSSSQEEVRDDAAEPNRDAPLGAGGRFSEHVLAGSEP